MLVIIMEYTIQKVFNKFGNKYLDKYNYDYKKINIYNKLSIF